MVAFPEPEPELEEAARTSGTLKARIARAKKERTRVELLTELLFGPLARLVVFALLPARVPPVAVVLANTAAGLAAAGAIASGDLLSGALLLQLKTILDNADGQLARTSGRTSALGRYLDTEADLVVNGAVFGALGYETGAPALAAVGFLGLTLVLSTGYNVDVLYRRARGQIVVTQPTARDEGPLARAAARLYAFLFAPHDRLLQSLSRRRLERILQPVRDPDLRERVTLAYHDGATLAVLANLGLSTQLAVLGVLLAAGIPVAFLWFALGCAALLILLQLRREAIARRVLVGMGRGSDGGR